MSDIPDTHEGPSPLEAFLRKYLETSGGVWDEIEPQVYDVMLPAGAEVPASRANESGIFRLAFDPEALPEHPSAQLASFGTPLVDQLLADALQRGRSAHSYLIGVNLQPHDLASRLRRALGVASPLTLHLDHVRALHFPQAVFWFQASFLSEQKEQVILPLGIDLHEGREVRHLEELLQPSRLTDRPVQPLPPARTLRLEQGYALARQQILRSVAALANSRAREMHERLDVQIARLLRYYSDLRQEMEEQLSRARNVEEAQARHRERLTALQHEEQLRVAELRQKNVLRVELRLLQLLRVEQPKLQIQASLQAPEHAPGRLVLIWDPLLETLEAPSCPTCHRPSYSFHLSKQGRVTCDACRASQPAGPRPGRK